MRRVELYFEHLITHMNDQHTAIANGVNWFQLNLNHSLRKYKAEFRKRLSEQNLMDPTIHTYHQVYYWAQ